MKNPFDPKDGEFAQNISGDDTELRQSLQAFGWRPEFPALTDENDVVLVGNRRMKIAKELGIEPVVEMINFGKGDAADAERFKVAIASNIGFQQMTAEDRKRIAAHLYGKDWTMQRIAEALGTTHKTISKDLNEFVPEVQNKTRAKTASNPKGAGRPKGTLKPERRLNTAPTVEAAAKAVLDEGKTYAEAEALTGLSNTVLRSAVAREEGRREARAEVPPLALSEMPHSMAQRYAAALKKARNELREEITEEIRKSYLDMIERYKQRLIEADRIIASHKGIFSRQDYRKILACLHPDHNSFQFAAEALQAFRAHEKVLVKPDPPALPRGAPPLPTLAEMMASRERVSAKRREMRAQQRAGR